ncbi:MAG: type II toxin-antitoxin system RelE/ParE family toxin [Deltaproteobacteria bacterium]|nr:type II toxin-antitoxin system RelE/ParE family toxin [Deltaproteobacteria bacterium]
MYNVEFTREAEADLIPLSKPIAQRILKKLRWLAENLDVITPEPLTGQWHGTFKLRIGDYRVLYTFNKTQQKIIVHLVGHRSKIYKIR